MHHATAPETIIRCTNPAKPRAKPLGFSGRISPFSVDARPKSTKGNQKFVDFSTLCEVQTASASFFLQYPVSNLIYGWLCATLLQVACDLLVGSMRPNFLKNQTNAIDLYLSPYQHQIPWTGPQFTMVGIWLWVLILRTIGKVAFTN